MVKELLSLLIGGGFLGYGIYSSISLASVSKTRFLPENSSNIYLSEEKWTKPDNPKPVISTVPIPPSTPAAPKVKGKKKPAPPKKETCELSTGTSGRRFKVESTGSLKCGSGKGK